MTTTHPTTVAQHLRTLVTITRTIENTDDHYPANLTNEQALRRSIMADLLRDELDESMRDAVAYGVNTTDIARATGIDPEEVPTVF